MPGRGRAAGARRLPVRRPAARRRGGHRLRRPHRQRPQVPPRAAGHRLPLRATRRSSPASGRSSARPARRPTGWRPTATSSGPTPAASSSSRPTSPRASASASPSTTRLGWGIDAIADPGGAPGRGPPRTRLAGIAGVTVHDKGARRCAITTFTVDGVPAGRGGRPRCGPRPSTSASPCPGSPSTTSPTAGSATSCGPRSTTSRPTTSSTAPPPRWPRSHGAGADGAALVHAGAGERARGRAGAGRRRGCRHLAVRGHRPRRRRGPRPLRHRHADAGGRARRPWPCGPSWSRTSKRRPRSPSTRPCRSPSSRRGPVGCTASRTASSPADPSST